MVPRNPQFAIRNLPFIGREPELRALRAAAASRQLALVEGEPGIGKTRLAEEYLRTLTALTLRSTAHELESTLPYQPISVALRDLLAAPDWPVLHTQLQLPEVWRREIARLAPEMYPDSVPLSTADESRLWEGVHQFVLALSRLQAIAWLIDDAQWADGSTLGLLGYLVRVTAASPNPIVFVAATRPVESRTPLETLIHSLTRAGLLSRITLDRLSLADTLALTQHISPTYAYPLADWLQQQAEGNPYLVNELISHARETGLLHSDGAVNLSALSAAPTVPPSVYSLIQARLSRLSDPARRILDAAVAMGRVFEFEIVRRAAGLSENAALDALDELRAARLIEAQSSEGLTFAFDHSLTMEVAYREVGEPRHRLLHRRVAEALEAIYGRQYLDGIAGVLAWHFSESGDVRRAAPYALRAAQLARRFAAWQEAISFYKQALLGDAPPLERAAVLIELGDAYLQAGETSPAIETYRAALKLCDPDNLEADRARLALARALLYQAHFAEAIVLAQQTTRPEMRVNAEMQWGTTLSVEGADLIGAAEHLLRAEALLRQQSQRPDPARLAQIKFELGSVAAQQGQLELAVALYREVITLGEQGSSEALPFLILGYNNLAYHLYLLDEATAIDFARQGLRLAQDQGALGLQPFLFSTLGEIELAHGDLDGAELHFKEGLALAERLSLPERIAGLTANWGRVAHQRGERDVARERLSSAYTQAEALGLPHLAAQIRLWLAPLLPADEARAALREVRSLAESTGRKRLLEQVIELEAEQASHH